MFNELVDAARTLDRLGIVREQFQARLAPALVQSVSDTLLYLTDHSRKGKTWGPVPSRKAKESDLLLAYFNGADADLLEAVSTAAMFGDGELSNAHFAALCEPAIRLLEAKLPDHPSLAARLLVLTKVSQGVQQVNLCRDISVQDLVEACTQWKAGAANAPLLTLPFNKDGKKGATRWLTSRAPYPLALSSTINRLWQTDPDNVLVCNFQHAFSASDAFDVFLWRNSLARQKAERALTLLVERMGRVLAALGKSQVRTHKNKYFAFGEDARKYALKALPLLGILLFRLGCHKEHFMQQPIYQLGRLLSLVDDLQKEYCEQVRDNSFPPQFIGNSFIPTALERPLDAFWQLNQRTNYFKAWAQTTHGRDAGLAKYFLFEIEKAIPLIAAGGEFPAKMTAQDKAELFFGYHSPNPKNPKKQPPADSDHNPTTEDSK